MSEYAIIFDIPKELATLRVRVNRAFKLIGVKKFQNSVWISKELDSLKRIAETIRKHGGRAVVIEWKKVF